MLDKWHKDGYKSATSPPDYVLSLYELSHLKYAERSPSEASETEDHAAQAGGEQSDGGFVGVVGVAEAEQDGKDEG